MTSLTCRVSKEDLARIKQQALQRGLTVSGYIRFLMEKDTQSIRTEQALTRLEKTVGFLFESITAINDLNIHSRLEGISYLARRINLIGNQLVIATLKDPVTTLTEIDRQMNERTG